MGIRPLLLVCLALLAAAQDAEFRCPMDADIRSAVPAKCPRCGMQLVRRSVGDREYLLEMRASTAPKVRLEFTVRDPATNRRVRRFQPVHERLFHLFVVSQNLEFFAHEHPTLDAGGRFRVDLAPPAGGLHRVLADFWPEGGTPQMAVK